MKIYTEVSSEYDFEFWSGAKDTIAYLTHEEIEQIFEMLEDAYPEGMGETELNDYFWFEDDDIAEQLGWPDFETLMDARSDGNWYDSYEEWEEHLEELEEQEDEDDNEEQEDEE